MTTTAQPSDIPRDDYQWRQTWLRIADRHWSARIVTPEDRAQQTVRGPIFAAPTIEITPAPVEHEPAEPCLAH